MKNIEKIENLKITNGLVHSDVYKEFYFRNGEIVNNAVWE